MYNLLRVIFASKYSDLRKEKEERGMEMTVSQLVKVLQGMHDVYGDLKVSLHLDQGPGDRPIITDDDIFLGYDQYEDGDKIDIRNFPY